MVECVEGKKLLILGGSANEISLVKRAKELGVYVIVVDYFKDRIKSPAKNYADEVWDDDWSDVDFIVNKCKENKVDGITAGYSEIKINYLIKICEKLNIPCYATAEQLEITRDKKKFKEECRKCGVSTVKEYNTIDEVDRYPVIVKPTDRGGSIGISIANNYNELVNAYSYAMDLSLEKRVIIEQYITDTKVDVYYAVMDGEIIQLTTNDAIMSGKNGIKRVVQDAWMYPHKKAKNSFIKEEKALKEMIKDMGIKNGCIFFSGFYDDDDNYTFFECGFRLEGGHQYNYTYQKGPFNFLDLFIYHALLGNSKNIQFTNKCMPDLKQVTVNLYAKKGVIKEIHGFDLLSKMPNCIFHLVSAHIGQECSEDRAILTKIGMFSIAARDSKIIEQDIENALKLISVVDLEGNDMIYSRIQTDFISSWWN